MAYKFAYTAADGSVVIVGAAPKAHIERARATVLTDEQYKAHVVARMKEKGTLPQDAVLTELPEDWSPPDGNRAYREAWKLNGKGVEVDMPKARLIHMDKYIRPRRNAKLDETDKQVAALDGGPVPQELKALRQKLRDMPATLDLSKCETVEQLKAMWPEELK